MCILAVVTICENLEIQCAHFWSLICTEAKSSAVRQQGVNKISEYEEGTEFKKERGKDCEMNPTTGRIPLSSKRELRDTEPCIQEEQAGTPPQGGFQNLEAMRV